MSAVPVQSVLYSPSRSVAGNEGRSKGAKRASVGGTFLDS